MTMFYRLCATFDDGSPLVGVPASDGMYPATPEGLAAARRDRDEMKAAGYVAWVENDIGQSCDFYPWLNTDSRVRRA